MRRVLSAFLLLLLFVQCSSNPTTVTKEDGVIKPLSFKEIDSNAAIKKQIADIKVMSFKFPEGVPAEPAKKIISTRDKGFVVMNFGEVYLFDADGRYVRELCSAGGYAQDQPRPLSDIATSYATNRIYLLDALNKVLCFDASTGDLIESITPDWGGERYRVDAIVPNESTGGFYIVSCNTSERKGKETKYVVTAFDDSGAMVEQYMEGDDYIIPRTMTSQSVANQYLMRPADNENIIYELKDGAPKPLYKVDFEGQEAPQYAVYNAKGTIRLSSYFENDYYKYVNSVTRTPHTLSFIAATPNNGAKHYIYDQNSGGGIYFSANDGHSVPVPFLFADDDYHYMDYRIYSESDLDTRADQLTQYLVSKLGVLDRGEGYKLVGIKFKQL